jgi:hypothetical protein
MIVKLKDKRFIDQYSTLLAGAYFLQDNNVDIDDYIDQFNFDVMIAEQKHEDSSASLGLIFDYKVRRGVDDVSLYSIVEEYFKSDNLNKYEIEKTLNLYGIKFSKKYESHVLLDTSNRYFIEMLRNTPYKGNIKKLLQRNPSCERVLSDPVYINGNAKRCILLQRDFFRND